MRPRLPRASEMRAAPATEASVYSWSAKTRLRESTRLATDTASRSETALRSASAALTVIVRSAIESLPTSFRLQPAMPASTRMTSEHARKNLTASGIAPLLFGEGPSRGLPGLSEAGKAGGLAQAHIAGELPGSCWIDATIYCEPGQRERPAARAHCAECFGVPSSATFTTKRPNPFALRRTQLPSRKKRIAAKSRTVV